MGPEYYGQPVMWGVPAHHYNALTLSNDLIIPTVRGIDLKLKHTSVSVMLVPPCIAEPLWRVCNLVVGVTARVDQEPWSTMFRGTPLIL